jgi:hypothetical protein
LIIGKRIRQCYFGVKICDMKLYDKYGKYKGELNENDVDPEESIIFVLVLCFAGGIGFLFESWFVFFVLMVLPYGIRLISPKFNAFLVNAARYVFLFVGITVFASVVNYFYELDNDMSIIQAIKYGRLGFGTFIVLGLIGLLVYKVIKARK